MYFCGAESQLRGICLSGVQRPGEYVLKLGLVVGELQQWLADCPALADAEQVFSRRVQ